MEPATLELLQAAESVRTRAYAPYSGYEVGAAVRDEQGRIHVGANVENLSYGATICAERAALAAMIAMGGLRCAAIAVVTRDGGTPCGICRQVLSELAADPERTRVWAMDEAGKHRSWTVAELLPDAFSSEAVPRTPPRA